MLDTCAFIDAVTEPDNLGANICALMEDYENEFCISIETIRLLCPDKYKKFSRFQVVRNKAHEDAFP